MIIWEKVKQVGTYSLAKLLAVVEVDAGEDLKQRL